MRRRHDETFDAVFARLFPRAVTATQRILGDRAAAEDVSAEAFARAYARWSTVGNLEHREAWILRVALNLALDVVRRRPISTEMSEPVDAADVATLRAALGQALHSLPRRQRQIVALRYLAGLTESEIAATLGLALGTVKTHTRRGIDTLRQRLGTDEEATDIEALSS